MPLTREVSCSFRLSTTAMHHARRSHARRRGCRSIVWLPLQLRATNTAKMKINRLLSLALAFCVLPHSVVAGGPGAGGPGADGGPGAMDTTTMPPDDITDTTVAPEDTNSTNTTVAPEVTTAAPDTTAGNSLPYGGLACQVCVNNCASCGNSGTASCKTVCEISQQDTATCDSQCYETLHLGCWVGSGNPQVPDCECKALCAHCGDSTTADCQTVCNIASDDTTCEQECAETLHLGEWTPVVGSTEPTCVCESLCTQCESVGSGTADCQTVCNIAADAATCSSVCAETLHLGEYYAPEGGATTPTSSGYYYGKMSVASVVAAVMVGAGVI